MIIVVPSSRPLAAAIHSFDESVNSAVHEFEYSNLLEKYEFLKENGVLLEVSMSSIKEKTRTLIHNIIETVKSLWKTVKAKVQNIINRIKARKQERLVNKVSKRMQRASAVFNFTMGALDKIFKKSSDPDLDFDDEDYNEFVRQSQNLYSDFSAECADMNQDMNDFLNSMM